MTEFDLTSRMSPYLDRHLVFPLLEFLPGKDLYNEADMLKGKIELLSKTNMVDFAMDVFSSLYPDKEVPKELRDKRVAVVSELKSLQSAVVPITQILEDKNVTEQIQNSRDGRQLFETLQKDHAFKPEYLDVLYDFAKFQYECGNYSGAAEYLYFHRVLAPPTDKNFMNALWGKLASEILMQNWETALEDVNRIKEIIDSGGQVGGMSLGGMGNPLQALQQRAWLIHWSLFVFFNHPKGRDHIIDLFLFQPQYLNTIQTMCPHILRYLTTAVITNKRRKNVIKDLVKVIQQESYTYKDPITEFIECLYVSFDFDAAQTKLRECETVINNDFFLVACLDDFIENARLFIFETFCRIHQCISINMLAAKLNMSEDDAEKWVVNMIRNARLDAKIDSEKGHVVMGTLGVSPYQQVIEKTKNQSVRAQMLCFNVEKKLGNKGDSTTSAAVPWNEKKEFD